MNQVGVDVDEVKGVEGFGGWYRCGEGRRGRGTGTWYSDGRFLVVLKAQPGGISQLRRLAEMRPFNVC